MIKNIYIILSITTLLSCKTNLMNETKEDYILELKSEYKDIKIEQINEYNSFILGYKLKKDDSTNYIYNETKKIITSSNQNDIIMNQLFSLKGSIVISSKSKNIIELKFKDIILKRQAYIGNDDEAIKNELKPTKVNDQVITINTHLENNNNAKSIILFPISNHTYEAGVSYSDNVYIEYEINQEKVVLVGKLTTKCLGFIKLKDNVCSMIIAKLIVDESSLPDKLKNNYTVSIQSFGKYLFDIKSNNFIYSNIIMNQDDKSYLENQIITTKTIEKYKYIASY